MLNKLYNRILPPNSIKRISLATVVLIFSYLFFSNVLLPYLVMFLYNIKNNIFIFTMGSYKNAIQSFTDYEEYLLFDITQIIAILIGYLFVLKIMKVKNINLINIISNNKKIISNNFNIKHFMIIAIALTFAINILSSILSQEIQNIINHFGHKIPEYPIKMKYDGVVPSLIYFFTICIAAPFIEELLLRGFLINILKPLGNFFAVTISAITFGIIHGNIFQAFGAICVGFIYGYIAIKTNKVIYSIILHSINNIYAYLCMFAIKYKLDNILLLLNNLGFVLALLGIILFILNYKKIDFEDTGRAIQKPYKCFVNFFLNPFATVLYVLLLINCFTV